MPLYLFRVVLVCCFSTNAGIGRNQWGSARCPACRFDRGWGVVPRLFNTKARHQAWLGQQLCWDFRRDMPRDSCPMAPSAQRKESRFGMLIHDLFLSRICATHPSYFSGRAVICSRQPLCILGENVENTVSSCNLEPVFAYSA